MTEKFEDRLLGELKTVVATREGATSREGARGRRAPVLRKRTLALAGSAAALATVAAIGVPAVIGANTNAAWAVSQETGGSVLVTIYDVKDADGLEARLAELGVKADVTYTPPSKICDPGRFRMDDTATQTATRMLPKDGSYLLKFEVDPERIGAKDTLVIETTKGVDPKRQGTHFQGVMMAVATGPVGDCTLVDRPDR